MTGAAVVCAAALAGCGSAASSPPAGDTSASASAPPASASAPGTPASSAPGSASPGASAAAAPCSSSGLSVTVDVRQGGAAAGSTYYPIDFTNTGSAACTLRGYPGVSFVTSRSGGHGAQIGAPATQNSGAPAATVTLPPGGAAHAVLQVVDAGNYGASACHPVTAHWLRVYPPGQAGAVYAAFTAQVCSARVPAKLGSPLAVYPVRDGKGQRGQAP